MGRVPTALSNNVWWQGYGLTMSLLGCALGRLEDDAIRVMAGYATQAQAPEFAPQRFNLAFGLQLLKCQAVTQAGPRSSASSNELIVRPLSRLHRERCICPGHCVCGSHPVSAELWVRLSVSACWLRNRLGHAYWVPGWHICNYYFCARL